MEKLPNEENDYYTYVDKLNELYAKKPKKVLKELRKTLENLDAIENKGFKIDNKYLTPEKIILYKVCTIVLAIVCVGFLNFMNLSMYLIGLIFFLAGIAIGLFIPGFGLIFLFSHGITGLCVMEGALLSEVFSSPLMTDSPTNIFIYLFINFALFVIATLFVIAHNLIYLQSKNKKIIIYPFILYFCGFLMSALLPHFFEFIYYL